MNYNPNTANDTLAIKYHRPQIKNACSGCLQFAFLHVIAQITVHNFVSNIFCFTIKNIPPDTTAFFTDAI